MNCGGWNFEPLSFNAEDQGISEWDQFDKEDLDIESTLLREAIQNSLDAKDRSQPNQPVTVRIAWLRESELGDPDLLDTLIRSLEAHLRATPRGAPERSNYAALVIEDFGTCGLTGRTDDPADTGHFRGFFYRHSSSVKAGRAGGRWGLGKLVFARISGWSCWFGFTTRLGDRRTFVMGKAAIGPRTVAQQRYPAFARYAVLRGGREQPIEDSLFLERFRQSFRLRRADGEPGLSVVAPWPRSRPDLAKLRHIVLTEWIVPILRGHLVIELQDETIDAGAARRLTPAVLGETTAAFVKDVVGSATPEVRLPEVRAYPLRELTEERIDVGALAGLRDAYAKGQTVAVCVPLAVFLKEPAAEQRGHVDLFLRQAGDSVAPFTLRLRNGITVPKGGSLRADGVHSALVAGDGPVAEFLADAEPPAHDTWTVTSRLKQRWRYAQQTLTLIRNPPPEAARAARHRRGPGAAGRAARLLLV